MSGTRQTGDYERVEKAIVYLSNNYGNKPELKDIAEEIGLSEPHIHRLFKRWAGLTPKQFVQFLAKENIKRILSDSKNILEASVRSNLSSQSRLYDLFVTYDAVTPGEYRTSGDQLRIEYGIHPTRFGKCLIGITDRGICYLSFLSDSKEQYYIDDLKSRWKNAEIVENSRRTSVTVKEIFNHNNTGTKKHFNLHLRGTNFQIKVWEALMKIPEGAIVTYSDLANYIELPKGVRAVSSAVANNPVSYLIPCHRVIKKSGVFHNYRWGKERKIAILLNECTSRHEDY